jgi:hypothetical protein
MDAVIAAAKSRITLGRGREVQLSLLPRENSLDPVKIFTLTRNGARVRRMRGCEVKHLPWQILHNAGDDAT